MDSSTRSGSGDATHGENPSGEGSSSPPAREAAGKRWAGYAAAAVLAGLFLVVALFAASRLSQSKMERLAQLEDHRLQVEGYAPRAERSGADDSSADSTALSQQYLRALSQLRAARTTTLGLFPRYDAQQLRRAEQALEGVAEAAEAGSFVQLEALFFLGKTRLAQGDRAGATQALRKVVVGGGRLAPEAQEILTALYEEAAYEGPPADE